MAMFPSKTFFALGVLLLLAGCHSRKDASRWYKGNLHTHSYWSDGDEYPEMIMDWYKSHGYQFVALSDHNTLAEGDKWITVPKSNMYEKGFDSYLKKYGDDWVVYEIDSGRTRVKLKTFPEYTQLFSDSGFLIIQSEEITDRFGDHPIHMNATNIQSLIEPQGGESVTDVMQRNVDAVLRQRKETGTPMILHINHPNFFYGVSLQDIIDLHGERFFEVYNGHPMVQNYGDSTHPGTEEMWDKINLAYIQKNQPLLYGLATDDSHSYHQFGSAYSNAGRGWVMVKTDSLTPQSLIHALETGAFYASTGVSFEEITVNQNIIHLVVNAEPNTSYTISFIGAKSGDVQATVLKEVVGTDAQFEVNREHQFVRARVTSNKLKENPFHENEVEMAWTQPVMYRR